MTPYEQWQMETYGNIIGEDGDPPLENDTEVHPFSLTDKSFSDAE